MTLRKKHAVKRQCMTVALLFGGIIVFSRYGVPYNSDVLTQVADHRSLQEKTILEVDAVTQSPGSEHEILQTSSSNSTQTDVDHLLQVFVIDRKLPQKVGGVASPDIVYTRENTPGFFKRRNWHWTLTRLGEYNPGLYTVPADEAPAQRLPTVFLLGVSGCGLETLFEYVIMHPHLVAVAPDVRYFDLDDSLLKGMDWYKARMPLTFTNQITVEQNPTYFWDHRVPRKIYKMNPLVKFILVLRDPVERILSLRAARKIREGYLTSVDGVLKVNTKSWIVSSGIYVKFIKPWLQYFPLSQFHIVDYEDLVNRPVQQMQNLENFLGVPHKITEDNFYYNIATNSYCIRPLHIKGTMCPRTTASVARVRFFEERLLYAFYRDFNAELFDLLGWGFQWQPSDKRNIDHQI